MRDHESMLAVACKEFTECHDPEFSWPVQLKGPKVRQLHQDHPTTYIRVRARLARARAALAGGEEVCLSLARMRVQCRGPPCATDDPHG